jgi:hypothetical protein
MRQPKCLLVLLSGTLLTACSDGEPERYEAVPDVAYDLDAPIESKNLPTQVPRKLRANRFLGDTTSFGNVIAMLPIEDVLFVADALIDPHISAWSITTGTLIGRVGRHGQGPNEFRYPDWMLAMRGAPTQVIIFDYKNRRFTYVSVNANGIVIDSMFPLHTPVRIERPFPVNGGYISNALTSDEAIIHLDRTGAVLRKIRWTEPFTDRDAPTATGRSLLNRTFIGATPSRDRFAVVYQFANLLVLFTPDGKPYATVNGPRRTEARYYFKDNRFFWEEGNEMAYWDVQLTDERIYALFCGCRLGDEGDQLPREIHVFDMAGVFLETLVLDYPVAAFAVDPEGHRIFGAVESPYPVIAEWVIN